MEIVLQDDTQTKSQLLIDHQEGHIGFTVLIPSKNTPLAWQQLDFGVDPDEWDHIKKFIDDQVNQYQYKQREEDRRLAKAANSAC